MAPTPSTWPETKWPPMRSLNFMARSRFTGVPEDREPSVVTVRVSGETSTEKSLSVLATTVKQAPFTLMLAPIVRSPSTVEAMMLSRVPAIPFDRVVTAPISSTMPLNMPGSHGDDISFTGRPLFFLQHDLPEYPHEYDDQDDNADRG